jgi:hypothetical protein
MPGNKLPFDLSHEEREELQCVMAELDLYPERRAAMLAELVLLRGLRAWASQHRDRFPPRLRATLYALAHRTELERVAADPAETGPFMDETAADRGEPEIEVIGDRKRD